MDLNPDIITFFNEIGVERLRIAVMQADCERFRNYCLRKFGWFRYHSPDYKLGSDQHKCESAWYRFYNDNCRVPQGIDRTRLSQGVLTREEVSAVLMPIYLEYLNRGIDLVQPTNDPSFWATQTLDNF